MMKEISISREWWNTIDSLQLLHVWTASFEEDRLAQKPSMSLILNYESIAINTTAEASLHSSW